MKNLKTILTIIVSISILFCVCPIANADNSSKITISEGTKNGNVVTFTITVPSGAGLRGDATDDGKINEQDVDKLTKYNLGTIKEINTITGDWDMDGAITASDTTMLSKALTTKYVPIKLEGTLANNSKLDISKIADGKYSVVVTIPADTKEGTIGVTLKKGAVIFKDHTTNEAISSKLFDIATNKDTNDQNNNNVKATDNTQAQTVLPKAGYKATILAVIAIVALFAVVGYRKYKNIDK